MDGRSQMDADLGPRADSSASKRPAYIRPVKRPAYGFMAYIALAAGIAIVGLGLVVKIQTARLDNAKAEIERVTLEFAGFKKETARLGKAAEERNTAEKKRQTAVNQERAKGYENRIASITTMYRGLRDQRGSASGSPVPAVPDTARAADDTARDKQLLDVLQHADLQTARLIELQQWAAEQGKVKE